ncbi:VOC family protein [Candidatus Neptunichlamydia sp. REUL1]|uniref:VOC family protein n=1 Tax=Candidatus Neptunichlamydia sp. REUL1 TaxID=3064277 RepID=UPI002930760A|nr:VOC family protein [Candidatus Neptunochlamydia sp. REUL1]
MTKTATMNQVVHFEIPYDDIEKAKEFYSIFDWELNDIPGMNYIGVRTTPIDEDKMPTQPGAINGGLMKRTEQVKGPVVAVQVGSVDTYLEKVLAKGGKVIMPNMEIPNMGYYAYAADLEDNVFGLWEPIAP